MYTYAYDCQTNLHMHSLMVENTVGNRGDNQDTESPSSMLVRNTELVKRKGIVESLLLCICFLMVGILLKHENVLSIPILEWFYFFYECLYLCKTFDARYKYIRLYIINRVSFLV